MIQRTKHNNITYTYTHTYIYTERERREMDGDGKKGPVCVTGGTGFVASWLIMKLLQQGYIVRTTVRSYPDTTRDLSFLTNLPGASQNLQIYSADLDRPESFDPVIQGCTGVFHVAVQSDMKSGEPEEIRTQRAINAILAILTSCLNSKTVKRVVYTSSAGTVVFNDKGSTVMDENNWSDPSLIKTLGSYLDTFLISKTRTEQAALEFSEKNGIDFVSVLPTYINGPFLCPVLPGSVSASLSMIFGDKDVYKVLQRFPLVHVDDVASAHIFLFEHPNAKGRYNCQGIDITRNQMSEFLSARYPQYQIPSPESLEEYEVESKYVSLSTKKLLDTGFEFKYGLEEMYDEAINCCKEKGFL